MGDNVESVDPLTPETFSFFDILNGIEYPKDTVEIYLDEAAAHKQRELHRRVMNEPDGGFSDEEKRSILDDRAKIEARLDASKYTFKITGVPDDLITDAKTLADEKFNVPRKAADGMLRQVLPENKQMDYMRFLSATINALHIEEIIAPNGARMVAPSVEEIAELYGKAPSSQKRKLSSAIDGLTVEADEFENRVDADF